MAEVNIPNIHSKLLREDKGLELSCGNFKALQNIVMGHLNNKQVVYNLKFMKPYPSHKIIAEFASIAYEELDKQEKCNLPSGWQFLATASNPADDNGYFGAVYLHSNNRHMLIAHRGTKIENAGAFHTNAIGVIENEFVPQMNSACTLAIKVKSILWEIEKTKKDGVQFQLFFTGHSLGGWLAQVTTFAAEYLDIDITTGLLNANTLLGSKRHAHTVAFESPGCKQMLSKMKKNVAKNINGQCSLKALDITIILSNLNIINSIAEHVVQPCQIQRALRWWQKLPILYTLHVHEMHGILQGLQEKNTNLFAALDWPITTVPRYFANWCNSLLPCVPGPIRTVVEMIKTKIAKMVINPRTIVNGENSDQLLILHPLDDKKRNLRIFTESEKTFLETYVQVRSILEHCGCDTFCAIINQKEHCNQVLKSLGDFMIENSQISCEHAKLELFIPYVQQLLYGHGDLIGALRNLPLEFTIRKKLYGNQHVCFWESYKHLCLDFKETDDRMDFSVWQVITEDEVDIHIITMKIYKHVECNAKGSELAVLTLKQLLQVDKISSFKDLLYLPQMKDHWYIIECEQDRDSYEEPEKLLQCIRNVVNEKLDIKFIFVTKKDGNFTTLIQEEYKDRVLYRETKHGLCWAELPADSQYQLFSKKVIDINGQLTCLDEFGANSDDLCSTIMDSGAINQLIKGERMKRGENQQRLSELPAAFSSIYKKIPQTILMDALKLCPEESLFLVTSSSNIDMDGLMERLNIPRNRHKTLWDKVHLKCDLVEHQNDQAWQTICRKHRNKTIFWVQVEAHSVFCKQIYDPTFYFKRQLCLADMKSELKGILKSNKTSDGFIVSNVNDKMEFAGFLGIPVRNVKDFIFFAHTETAAEKRFNSLSKGDKPVHWLKIYQNEYLIWFRTHGPLKLLREYKSQESDNLVDVDEGMFQKNDFMYKDRILVIAGAPGMGKSTTLTSLSEHISGMVIRRDLSNCNHAIASLPLDTLTSNHVIDFVSKTEMGCPVTPLFNALLALGLQNKNRCKKSIHFMFDGYDEIHSDSRNRILNLLQFLKDNTKCNIWVTTRRHHQKQLEDNLSVFAITFKEADPHAQEVFLRKFWKTRHAVQLASKYDVIDTALSQHATNILAKAKEMFGRETSSFMGVPLQLRMLAEAYPPDIEASFEVESSAKCNSRLNKAGLFQRFIEMKYDIYFRKKVGFGNDLSKVQIQWFTESLQKKHRILAFQKLFPAYAETLLHINLQDCIKPELINLNELGWIQSNPQDGNFSFIHRSFAEYFVADLILHWLQKPRGRHPCYENLERFILSEILLKPEFKVIRLFLDGLLAKSDLQNSQFKFYKCRIATSLAEKQEFCFNARRQTSIYIAAEENTENLVKFLLSSFHDRPNDLAKLLSWHDKNIQTVLYVAANTVYLSKTKSQEKFSENHGVISQILHSIKDFPVALQEELILAACYRRGGDQSNPVLLNLLEIVNCYPHLQSIINALKEKWKLITPFLKCVLDNQIEGTKNLLDKAGSGEYGKMFRGLLMACTYKQNKTALYLAAQSGNSEMVRLLISEGVDVNFSYDSLTPLHAAAENKHVTVVTELLKGNADLSAVDKAQKTALHYAVASGDKAVVQVLLQHDKSPCISIQNPFNCSPEIFEMNGRTLSNDLPYCLFSKQFQDMPKKQMSEIVDCYNMVINKSSELFGPQDMRTLKIRATLAKVLFQNENFQQSLDVYQNVLQGIDPCHENVLQIQSSIAQILCKIGKHDDALPFYEDIFKKRVKINGAKHRETLLAKHYIAKILSYQGKFKESLVSYKEVTELLPDNRANYHDILIAKHNTAQLLAYMGEFAESLSLFEQNRAKFSKSFGKNHSFTLITTLNIAQLFSNFGAYEKALHFYDICIISEKEVGCGCDGRTFKNTAEQDKERTRVQLATQ